MFKICWENDAVGNYFEYFYDGKENTTYCINLAKYYKSYAWTSSVPYLGGAMATILGAVTKGLYVKDGVASLILLLAITLIVMALIHIGYKSSENKMFKYIKANGEKAVLEDKELFRYYKTGKRYRNGLLGFAGVCALVFGWAVFLCCKEHSLISFLMAIVCAAGMEIWLEILAPIKALRLGIHLKKALKEQK